MLSWGASALARVVVPAGSPAAMEGSRRITWTIRVASELGKKGKTDACDYDCYACDRDHWACGHFQHLGRAGERCVDRNRSDWRVAGATSSVQPRPRYSGLRASWLQPPRVPDRPTPSLNALPTNSNAGPVAQAAGLSIARPPITAVQTAAAAPSRKPLHHRDQSSGNSPQRAWLYWLHNDVRGRARFPCDTTCKDE